MREGQSNINKMSIVLLVFSNSLLSQVVVVFLEFLMDTDPGVGELQGDPEPEQGTVLPDQFD